MLSLFNTGYGLQDQLDGVKNGIAIVATNNTHIAITSGQYVYIQDHGTLAEGLYRATANIAANATLSSSNVTAVSGGGLNALNSNVTYTTIPITIATDESFTPTNKNRGKANKEGAIILIDGSISVTGSGLHEFESIPSAYAPSADVFSVGIVGDTTPITLYLAANGKIYVFGQASGTLRGQISYVIGK